MKDWEVAALIGGLVGIGLIVKNPDSLKNITQKISPIIQGQNQIIPVSTTTSPWEPVPGNKKKGVCPPGMYEDFTDGVLRCHSSHGTR